MRVPGVQIDPFVANHQVRAERGRTEVVVLETSDMKSLDDLRGELSTSEKLNSSVQIERSRSSCLPSVPSRPPP
jgi:hypothetical protein